MQAGAGKLVKRYHVGLKSSRMHGYSHKLESRPVMDIPVATWGSLDSGQENNAARTPVWPFRNLCGVHVLGNKA